MADDSDVCPENHMPTFPVSVFSVCTTLNVKATLFSETSKCFQSTTLSQYTEDIYFISHLRADINPTTFSLDFWILKVIQRCLELKNKIVGFLSDKFTRKSKGLHGEKIPIVTELFCSVSITDVIFISKRQQFPHNIATDLHRNIHSFH